MSDESNEKAMTRPVIKWKELLKDNKIEELLADMESFYEEIKDSEKRKLILSLMARFNENKAAQNQNTISQDDFNREQNKIREAILGLFIG